MAKQKTIQITQDEAYQIRDALIYAERAHQEDADPGLRQQYITLFRKLGERLQTVQSR